MNRTQTKQIHVGPVGVARPLGLLLAGVGLDDAGNELVASTSPVTIFTSIPAS